MKIIRYRIRGKTFEEINTGDEYSIGARTVTEVVNFSSLSNDFRPEHMNDKFSAHGAMGARIAHGLATGAIQEGHAPGIFEN